jgi:hypothetical protein
MRLRRRKRISLAAWLGFVALGIQALVPIHLAFDLVAALDQGGTKPAHADRPEGELLAALAGHHHPRNNPNRGSDSHHADCMVCNSLGTLGTLAPPLPAALPSPVLLPSAPAFAALPTKLAGASPAGYFSRAPPIG